jgi:hypothetical protein
MFFTHIIRETITILEFFNQLCPCVNASAVVRKSSDALASAANIIMAVLELAKQIVINYPAMTYIA